MKFFHVITAFFMLAISLAAKEVATPKDSSNKYFKVSQRIKLPENTANAFAGKISNGQLLIGGKNSKSIYFLPQTSTDWQKVGELDSVISNGTAFTVNDTVYCAGGLNAGKNSRKVFSVSYVKGKLSTKQYKDLPTDVKNISGVILNGKLYVAGQTEGCNIFLFLDLKSNQWQEPLSWDKTRVAKPALAIQNKKLFLFSSAVAPNVTSAYKYTNSKWTKIGDSPYSLADVKAFPCGDAHILLLNQNDKDIYSFFVTTEGWAKFGQLPVKSKVDSVTYSRKAFNVYGDGSTIKAAAIFPPTKYGILDYLVVAAFFIAMLFVGKHVSKKEKSENDFFRGGQRIPWWAAGLSMFATGASAISLMAMPAKAFTDNWIYASISIFQLVALPITIFLIVPLTRRLKVATAFEYLERRYNPTMRMAGSVIYSLNQMLARMAAIMLLPALAMSAICGIPINVSIIIMGVITTIYAAMGGLEAVIWTDVIQAIVMILAMVLCVIWVVMSLHGGFDSSWGVIQAHNKLQMWDFSWDIAKPIIYLAFLSNIIIPFTFLGDQNFIQRVQCTKDEKTACKAAATQLFVAVPLNFLLFGLGTCLFLFYQQNPQMLCPAIKADSVFPLFAAQILPTGLAGVVIAAIMAATMSTLSSAINSVANLGVEDFLRRFKPDVSNGDCVVWGRIFTAALGAFGTIAALLLANTSLKSIWDLALMIGGMIHYPIIGVFVLGIFTRRTSTTGAFAGIIASVTVTWVSKQFFEIHPLFYGLLSMLCCMIIGYLVSLIVPDKKRDLKGLTAFTLPEKAVAETVEAKKGV